MKTQSLPSTSPDDIGAPDDPASQSMVQTGEAPDPMDLASNDNPEALNLQNRLHTTPDVRSGEIVDTAEREAQVGELADEVGETAIGTIFVWPDQTTDIALSSPEREVAEQENIGKLLGRVRYTMDPYERFFKSQIWNPEENTRTTFRHRIKVGAEGKKHLPAYRTVRNGLDVEYEADINFVQNEDANTLTNAKVTIYRTQRRPPGISPVYPSLDMKFQNGTLSAIDLTIGRSLTLKRITEGTQLDKLLSGYMSEVGGQKLREGNMRIDFAHPDGPHVNLVDRWDRPVADLAFDAYQNKFTVRNQSQSVANSGVREINPDEFMQITRELMGLIPVVDQIKLFGDSATIAASGA